MAYLPDGGIDEESLRRQVSWAIGHGVDGLGLALGSEMPRLGEEERSAATRAVVDEAAGRVPVVVHASAQSAPLAAQLARRAEADGASALMAFPPTFDPTGPGVDAFFRELLDATSLPLVLQDIPDARVD